MRILIACLHHRQSTGRSLYEALGEMGHDVRHVGGYLRDADREGKWAWHALGDWDHAWSDWTPDVVVYADTVWKDWRHPRYHAVPHAHVCSCNNVVNMANGPWERHFLASNHSDVWPIERADEEWMPCGYSPRWHTPSPIPYSERMFDVAMIGRLDKERCAVLSAMENAGLSVFHTNGLWYSDYTAAYHNARMSLCTNTQRSAMKRYFESAAMGVLVIGDKCQDISDLGGAAHMVQVDSNVIDELVASARYYVTRFDDAEEKISGALEWVKVHRWQDRAQQIVDWIERIT